jgi:RND superfamily putative drug exporter
VSAGGEQRPDPGAALPIRPIPRSLARLIVHLRFPIVVAWIAAAVFMTMTLPGLGDAGGGGLGGVVPEDSEALRAEEASLQRFSFPLSSRTMVIERDPVGLSKGAQARIVRRDLRVTRRHVSPFSHLLGALPVPNTLPLLPFGTEHGTAVLTYLFTSPKLGLTKNTVLAEHLASHRRAVGPAPEVEATGTIPAQIEQGNVISHNLIWLDLATVLLVLVVVGLHFRALAPPLVSLAAVAVALLVSDRVVVWVAAHAGLEVSSDVTPVMTVLLFGVLTDYSIFFMTRFRAMLEEEGMETVAAARRCAGELLPVISTAGLVIALATASLYFAQLGFLRGLGPGLAVPVLVATLAAATFVPAMLAIAGKAMLWPQRAAARDAPTKHTLGVGGRAVRLAVRHPVIVAAVCGALLVAAASGLTEIRTANSQMTNLPASSSVNRGYVLASKAFVPGVVAPTTVVLERRGIVDDRPALVKLQRLLSQQPAVAGAIGPGDNPLRKPLGVMVATNGDAARFLVVFKTDPLGARAISAVKRMRSRMPDLLSAAGLDDETPTLIGGDSALSADTADATHSDLLRVTPIALAVIFCMLALLLRALVAPAYLLIASVLGLLAALGLTTYFFQGVLGYSGISVLMPLTIAVLLLSLGSDYNVFLAARVWHEARVRPLREAIEVAGGRSTRAITVAGVVLAGSFGAAALIPLASFRELAFGMAVGLLIDAFIVRALLVPALISIVGPTSGWPGKRPGAVANDATPGDPPTPSEPAGRGLTSAQSDAEGA